MSSEAYEEILNIGEIKMRCIRFGKGASDLIMIQGLNTNGLRGTARMLARMYRSFAEKYTVYLFDRRENVPEKFTARQIAGDIALAMDELKIRNADVLGISQGGMAAQYLAIDRPELVHRLVLTVTLSRNNPTAQNVISRWIKLTEEKNFSALVADMAEKMYSETYVKKLMPFLPLMTSIQTPRDTDRFIILTKACLSCDTYEQLEKIQCPVLVIGGAKDKIVTGEASEEIARKLGCELYMYDDLGHAVYDEAKDFKKRVLDFFSREDQAAKQDT